MNVQQREKRKEKLSSSLLKILKSEQIEKVTVDQICKEAEVHRSTFYRYFVDKYDLLAFAFNNFWTTRVDTNNIVDSTIDIIYLNKDLFRNLSINNDNNAIYWVILRMWGSEIIKAHNDGLLKDIPWVDRFLSNTNHLQLSANMVAGALLTVLFEWVGNNYQMTPQEISDFIHNM